MVIQNKDNNKRGRASCFHGRDQGPKIAGELKKNDTPWASYLFLGAEDIPKRRLVPATCGGGLAGGGNGDADDWEDRTWADSAVVKVAAGCGI
jgi:hypothetical protein